MKKNFIIYTLLLLSCGKAEQITPGKEILLGVESESISEKIERVSIVPFEVDDSWKYISAPLMAKAGDTFFLCTQETCFLLGFNEDGKKLFSRNIKGRGRGEVLEVNNIYTSGDTVFLFDVAKGELEMYDKEGKFCSKIEGPFLAEYLYPLNDNLVGMTATRFKGNKYVTIYDKEQNVIENYLTIPDYLKNQSMSFGQTPMSYCYKDSVRFMMPYDYNLYSVSENGIESKYLFVPENPIPPEVLEKMKCDLPILERIQLVGPYDDDFQGLFETDRFLYFYYSRKHVLYDKKTEIVYKTQNPDEYFHKDLVDDMTSDDVWRYFIGSFLPLYSEENRLYGRLPYNIYQILNDCRDKLDSKLIAFLSGIEVYFNKYTLASDDVIIVCVDFDEE